MPDVYKALVPTRWKNRITGRYESAFAGAVVSFDDGDFAVPGEPSLALPPIADLIQRGQFEVWDPKHAGDPEYMSRDEMLHIIKAAGLTEEPPEHDAPLEELRPIVQAHLDRMSAAGNEPPEAEKPTPRAARKG